MNAYQVLGVSESASDEEIVAAYRRLVMIHHPDRGGDPDEFLAVKKAFESLQNRVCPLCKGTGRVVVRQGAFVSKDFCPRCWK